MTIGSRLRAGQGKSDRRKYLGPSRNEAGCTGTKVYASSLITLLVMMNQKLIHQNLTITKRTPFLNVAASSRTLIGARGPNFNRL